MGSNKDGFKNEYDLINYLNGKIFYQLNENMKEFIKFMYPNIREFDVIHANSGKFGQKPDLIIIVNGVSKKVSLKKGSGNSVHQESVESFMDFLDNLNVDEKVKIELLKYHWSDGSVDGTGGVRVSSREYKHANKEQIELINKELNTTSVLRKIVDRVLFQGKSMEYDRAECVYYGTIEKGKWAWDIEILNYIENKNFNSVNSVHFGPLTYQIWNSCLNYNPRTEDRRYIMQLKWGSLDYDLEIITQEREKNE